MDYTLFLSKNDTDRTLHEFEGLVKGILLDNELNEKEVIALRTWIDNNTHFLSKSNKGVTKNIFTDLYSAFYSKSGEILIDDIFMCLRNISFKSIYYKEDTTNIQILIGLLRGIVADRVINQKEINNLIVWLKDHSSLQSMYPYNLLVKLLQIGTVDEGIITDNEGKLMELCIGFESDYANQSVVNNDIEVIFANKHFCFSGYSDSYSKKEVQEKIESLSGFYHKSMCKKVDYLILGDKKSEGWAYGSYGRKVESALNNGIPVVSESVLSVT